MTPILLYILGHLIMPTGYFTLFILRQVRLITGNDIQMFRVEYEKSDHIYFSTAGWCG
ncbi:hypothetical protein EPIR_0176 [Erwinia piriflorinigrans CFBP 5888]|uniref:Uncharacterized protein n=1 Tax=Erwinia piriflorinigrans CFBP 5888 TaxID=1161919 RepID=V5Z3Q3_9GAMM|nr:hypothetical protein EPIR_0176 [Erwinia piriflorinigrans CFBP 5888]